MENKGLKMYQELEKIGNFSDKFFKDENTHMLKKITYLEDFVWYYSKYSLDNGENYIGCIKELNKLYFVKITQEGVEGLFKIKDIDILDKTYKDLKTLLKKINKYKYVDLDKNERWLSEWVKFSTDIKEILKKGSKIEGINLYKKEGSL